MKWTFGFMRLKLLGLCPHCMELQFGLDMHASNGSRLHPFTPMWCFRGGDYALCRSCGKSVDVFKDQIAELSQVKESA